MKFSIRSGAYWYSVNLHKYQKILSVQLYVSLSSIYWYHLYNYVRQQCRSVSKKNIPQKIQTAHQKSAKLCLKIRKHITTSHCVFQLSSTMWSLLLMVLALTGISTSSVSSYHEDNKKKVCLICGRKCSYVLQSRHFKDLKEIMPDFSPTDSRYPLGLCPR